MSIAFNKVWTYSLSRTWLKSPLGGNTVVVCGREAFGDSVVVRPSKEQKETPSKNSSSRKMTSPWKPQGPKDPELVSRRRYF